MRTLTGKCLCGAIAYEINGELGPIVNCHCSKCRRWHGAAFRTRATVKSKDFKWVKGEDNLSKYHSSKNVIKTFCKTCGSSLISMYEDKPDYIGLPIVDSKSPWYEITDNLPQYEELPGIDIDSVLQRE